MSKKKTNKELEQDLKEALSQFKTLAPPDEDDDVEVITNTELTELVEEQAIDGMSYVERKSVSPDEDDNTDDKPAIDYFKDLTPSDLELREETEEKERESLQPLLDEMQAQQDEAYEKGLLPTRLQEIRHTIPTGVEDDWIVHIWNQVVNAKLYMKHKTRRTYIDKPDGTRIKKQKYRKTKETDKVSRIDQLKKRYKNARTWQAMELKIRKIGFYALDMGNLYNASQWSSFISSNQDVDEFDDMLDNICNQLYEGFKI